MFHNNFIFANNLSNFTPMNKEKNIEILNEKLNSVENYKPKNNDGFVEMKKDLAELENQVRTTHNLNSLKVDVLDNSFEPLTTGLVSDLQDGMSQLFQLLIEFEDKVEHI